MSILFLYLVTPVAVATLQVEIGLVGGRRQMRKPCFSILKDLGRDLSGVANEQNKQAYG
jgi:hypothetical protein